MTLIEMMFGNFQTEQGTAITRMGAQSTRKSEETGNGGSFVDILKSSMSSSDKTSVKNAGISSGSLQKEIYKNAVKSDSTPVIRSFREANEYSRRMNKTIASDSTKAGKGIKECVQTHEKAQDADDASELGNPENVVQIVSQLLGLEVHEFQKLLSEAGITPESFGSLQSVSEISSDLAQILGLNNSQQKTLEIMFQTAAELLGEAAEGNNEQSAPAHLSAASENPQPDMTAGTAQDIATSSIPTQSPLEQLSEQIRQKLDEYGIRLEEGEDSVQEDIKALMLPMLEKSTAKIQQTVHASAQIAVEGQESVITAVGAEEMPKESSLEEDNESEQSTANIGLSPKSDAQPAASNATQTQPVFSSILQSNQVVEKMPVSAPVSAPVNTKEILGQIIEKAQIIMMPDKSEMLMELKPDSLGKLSLKLVTENGIVMAKFVAENQQVKEVLETNMQLLKDSLQKQGLDVQGFSVSVRQDSNRSGWNNRQEGRTGSFAREPVSAVMASEGQIPVYSEAVGRRNPYVRETSTIELSA